MVKHEFQHAALASFNVR